MLHHLIQTMFLLNVCRLSNAVLLLKEFTKEQEARQLRIVFMYDIACKLKPHLEVTLHN